MLLSVVTLLLQFAYILCVVGLSLYGGNALWLTYCHWQSHRPHRQSDERRGDELVRIHSAHNLPHPLPHVTIQLPVFNEQHVVRRLLRACAKMRYPKEKLQIQILDDSNDHTSKLIQHEVEILNRKDIRAEIVYRSAREGFKAGALQNGLSTATGEFIAIFDADFEPSEDFLFHTLPYFFDSDNHRIGFVQTRWAHLNAGYSPLTQSQALALDGHFTVEQPARQSAGYFFGFNGSGGIWRRACIEDPQVGGWQIDTLCEDLDLSYRAQLAGWEGRFLPHVTSPAEIPPQLLAFKRQQFRWAKGSIQTLRKLATRVLGAPLPLVTKLQACIHLGSYLIHPLLLLLLLITLPLELLPVEPIVPLPWLSLTSLGPPLLYATAQYRLYGPHWWRRWRYIPLLTLLGTGLSLNNSLAVFQGLFRSGGEFLRTPKFKVETRADKWQQSIYRLKVQPIVAAEFGLTLYALATCAALISGRNWWSLPFLLLYAGGFGLMATIGLWQSMPSRRAFSFRPTRLRYKEEPVADSAVTPRATAPARHQVEIRRPYRAGRTQAKSRFSL